MQQPPFDRPPISPPSGDNTNFGNVLNNSGQPGAQLPAELAGLNFGAFLLNWIWAIAHNYWLGLLCLVPGVGVVMQFYMLFKGNEAAWQSRRWESIAQFKEVQHKWMLWGVALLVVSCIFSGVIMALSAMYFSTMPTSTSPTTAF